jgi:hypothetical protein
VAPQLIGSGLVASWLACGGRSDFRLLASFGWIRRVHPCGLVLLRHDINLSAGTVPGGARCEACARVVPRLQRP